MRNPDYFVQARDPFLLQGPAGVLEALAQSNPDPRGVAILCHPHPLYQGTMHNKVVSTLARAFFNQQFHTLRFNYRGVGKSQGQYGHSKGEIEDLIAVKHWVHAVLPKLPVYLAGFSFGAYIAAAVASQGACAHLISIAPAVTNQPYDRIGKMDCPWLVVQGEKDEVIETEAVTSWFYQHEKNQPSMRLVLLSEASHFFHGCLSTLRTIIEDELA